ncbi:MAG TPA: hypothetical protein EYP35_11520 [Desulfobacterales bacterium]|nr:hypothetical protein [Desulfobacterales bacterium]HIP39683.1 hypothetical protein [Desulfocapsa sulfexigens]
MQTVSQSYSSQVYTQVQNGSPFPGDRINFGHETSSTAQSSEQSLDETVSLSSEGKKLSQKTASPTADETAYDQSNTPKGPDQQSLNAEEQKMLHELKARDIEVRSHEQAHLSAAGQYAAGGASFSYQTGPDGKRYASSGEVPIDMTKEKTPETTIQKMRTVRRAALAPASPSAADRNIAAQASTKEAQAMKEMQEQTEKSSKIESDPEQSSEDKNSDSISEEKVARSATPQISDYSRQAMASAYNTIAALSPNV